MNTVVARKPLFVFGLLLVALLIPLSTTAQVHRASEDQADDRRALPLQHTQNARDLGGYRTTDGRTVKWGVLYRSDSLAALDAADLDYLSGLQLATVTDFRSTQERELAPDRLPEQSPAITYNTVGVNNPAVDAAEIGRMLFSGQLTEAQLQPLLDRRSYITDTQLRQAWGNWLHSLAEPGALPQLFHCTAGKDRTGYAAALVLLTLGVSRDQVMDDFLLSNQLLQQRIEDGTRRIQSHAQSPVDEKLLAQVLGVSPASLEGAFNQMEASYGSIDNFITEGLGIEEVTRQRLRALLLE